MKTNSTLLKRDYILRNYLLKGLMLFILTISCNSIVHSQTTPSVLYQQASNSPFIINNKEYVTLYESETLYHKSNLEIYFEAIGFADDAPDAKVELWTSVDIISYDINGIEGQESKDFLYRSNNIQTIPIKIPDESISYKIRLRAKSDGYITTSPRIRLTKITATAATPYNIEVERTGDNSIYVKWDSEHLDQRQRFAVELLKNDGSSLSPKVMSEFTEGSEINFEYPISVVNHKVRVNLYGDGENSNNTIASTNSVDLLYRSTSEFLMPTRYVIVNLRGVGDHKINLLNASGRVAHSETVTLKTDTILKTKISRDGATNTETLLDNEFKVQVISENIDNTLSKAPIIATGNDLYNEKYLAQLTSNIAGVYNDKFELVTSDDDEQLYTSSTKTNVYLKDSVVFKLSNKVKHIDLRTDTLSSEGGYQAVIRFQAMRSNNGHTPKLQFFVADINNNILEEITSPSILVEDNTLVDKVVTLIVPSTVTTPHKIIIRCTAEDMQNPNVTCTLKNLRISRHDNIATNVQLSSCGNNLNVSWDIANSDESVNNNYFVQILDENGTWYVGRSTIVNENKVSIPLGKVLVESATYKNLESGIYKIRVVTRDKNNTRLGISALYSFVYIKAGETLNTGTTDNINFLMMGLEDNGNTGAINRAAQLTTSNTALSVNKVALQIKIKK
ncbi:MAG: hypothetical protein ACRC6R_08670, partial [Bacteroidales bacterium]